MTNTSIMPCPFCGSPARLMGGPIAQERYSIWCDNNHHLDGGMDADKLIDEWNTRHTQEGYVLVPVELLDDLAELLEIYGEYDHPSVVRAKAMITAKQQDK